MKVLYSAKVKCKGGRNGSIQSEDRRFRAALRPPAEMGGDDNSEKSTNPEQLFAGAYGACFFSALQNAARSARIRLKDSSLTTVVNLRETSDGGYQLGVELRGDMPGVDPSTAEKLMEQAHRTCPYSKALRGNAEVKLALAGGKRVKARHRVLSFGH